MNTDILLITPPFTQLNTPYPATAYLKSFLSAKEISSYQIDLGIEVILEIFSSKGLESVFSEVENSNKELSGNCKRIITLKKDYINTIDSVISFLQGKNPTLAHRICEGIYLPEASRFNNSNDLDWAFGSLGLSDKAKHLATLYLEDISDLITETIDPHFGFSRYAEKLGRSANSFDEIETALKKGNSFIDNLTLKILEEKIQLTQPSIVALSIPFPGNLYSGLKCGQWLKKNYPNIKIVLGGGFANTELRSLSEKQVFNYVDYITLDDGEAPLLRIFEHTKGLCKQTELKRSFCIVNDSIAYINNNLEPDYSIQTTGTPDYTNLPLDKYISVIEIANPMHRLWSDGRWNKLTLAHGCYWGRCTFCDISLDYIKRFETQTAKTICNKIEKIIEQTGETGFHFVDEAAPPALLKELALELIRRNISISWWGNIRFEKNFTQDLCILLKESGCIAVSGGLEVASDRLLSIINKGVTVAQVAKVAQHFTNANIMVHAYLMYGFPTQTAQETIDSLEIVRQIFMHGIVQSGFWHLFTMTTHSAIGLNPKKYNVKKQTNELGTFANNDILHIDKTGAEHENFSNGLKKALFNYMHGICFDYSLNEWFDFKVPRSKIAHNYIENILTEIQIDNISPSSKLIWLGNQPEIKHFTKNRKGKSFKMTELLFVSKKENFSIKLKQADGEWLNNQLQHLSINNNTSISYGELLNDYENNNLGDFDILFLGKSFQQLRQKGLLVL